MAEALRRHAGLFLRFGGHAAAAGFTARASELRALKERLQGDARNALPLSSLTPSLDVDAEVTFRELVGPVYRLIESMAPFGSGNMAPVFVTRNVRVAEVRPAGASGQHLRLKLWQGGATWDAIAFNFVEDRAAQGDVGLAARLGSGPVDVAYRLGVDFFSGEPMVRLLVVDLRPAGPGA
jgi:single-stranded-DNA-specific exonuclease